MSRGAPVAESVDAADSKSVSRKGVGVRVSPGAPPYAFGFGWQARLPKLYGGQATQWTDTRRRLGVGVSAEAFLPAEASAKVGA